MSMREEGVTIQPDQPAADRRRESRVCSSGVGELTSMDTTAAEPMVAVVLDVSRSGLQIELDTPFETGSNVKLRLRDVTVIGQVGNCRPVGLGRYRVGLMTRQVIERLSG